MGAINNQALIVHGWTYSTEKYKKIAKLLTNYGIPTKILNVPGLTEEIDKPWTIDDYVEWLRQKIETKGFNNEAMKQSNNDVILIGHSNGGRIALNFAIKYPQKLDRLILIDSAGIKHDELHVKIRLLFFYVLAKIGKKMFYSKTLKNLLYKMASASDYNLANPHVKKTMTNLIESDSSLNFAKIKSPTLIIWGENDKVTPLSDGKVIHKLIPNSKLYIVKGAKHSPHYTHAEEVGEIMLKYLKIQNAKMNSSR